jgi:NADH-quinone oxidoreductase subunit H
VIGPALALLLLVLGVILPATSWLTRRLPALLEHRVSPGPIVAPLRPVADLLKAAAKAPRRSEGSGILHSLAVFASFLTMVALFALLPFGGTYAFGEHAVAIIVSDLDGSLLWLPAGLAIAGLSSLTLSLGSEAFPVAGAARHARLTMLLVAASGLILFGVALSSGTLRVAEIAASQDATIRLFGWLERLPFVELPGAVLALRVPAWGALVQPLGFLLFVAVASIACRGSFLSPSAVPGGGPRASLLRAAELLRRPLFAAWIAALYLGAWSIPYADQERIIGAVSILGVGFGTACCALLHIASFSLKASSMLVLLILADAALPELRQDRLHRLLSGVVIPLALLNAALVSVAGFLS